MPKTVMANTRKYRDVVTTVFHPSFFFNLLHEVRYWSGNYFKKLFYEKGGTNPHEEPA